MVCIGKDLKDHLSPALLLWQTLHKAPHLHRELLPHGQPQAAQFSLEITHSQAGGEAGQATGKRQHKGWEGSQQPGTMARAVPGAPPVLPQQS